MIGVERRAQLVAHVGEELALGAVGLLGPDRQILGAGGGGLELAVGLQQLRRHHRALGDVAHHGLHHRPAIQLQSVEQHVGGERHAVVNPPVHPFEVVAALCHRRGDPLVGQRQGIATIRLLRRREISGMLGAEFLPGRAAEHRQGCRVAVEEAVIVQQHHRVAGRIIEGVKFCLRMAERLLGLTALRDVLENAVGAQDSIARTRGERPVVQPDPFAVFPAEAVFHVEGLALGKEPLVSLPDARRVVGMNPVHPQLAAFLQEFPGAVTQHIDGIAADVNQFPVGIRRPDHVRYMVNERTVFFLAGAQGLLGLFTLRDVLDHGLKLPRLALFPEQAPDAVFMPHLQLVRSVQTMVERNHRFRRRQRIDVAQWHGGILFGKGLKKIGANQFFAAFAVKMTEGFVDQREQAVGLEPADQIRLVLHHRAKPFFTFRHRAFGGSAFGGGGGQQHIGDRHNSNVTADQHQAVRLGMGHERTGAAHQRINRQRRHQQGAGGAPRAGQSAVNPRRERERADKPADNF